MPLNVIIIRLLVWYKAQFCQVYINIWAFANAFNKDKKAVRYISTEKSSAAYPNTLQPVAFVQQLKTEIMSMKLNHVVLIGNQCITTNSNILWKIILVVRWPSWCHQSFWQCYQFVPLQYSGITFSCFKWYCVASNYSCILYCLGYWLIVTLPRFVNYELNAFSHLVTEVQISLWLDKRVARDGTHFSPPR